MRILKRWRLKISLNNCFIAPLNNLFSTFFPLNIIIIKIIITKRKIKKLEVLEAYPFDGAGIVVPAIA